MAYLNKMYTLQNGSQNILVILLFQVISRTDMPLPNDYQTHLSTQPHHVVLFLQSQIPLDKSGDTIWIENIINNTKQRIPRHLNPQERG